MIFIRAADLLQYNTLHHSGPLNVLRAHFGRNEEKLRRHKCRLLIFPRQLPALMTSDQMFPGFLLRFTHTDVSAPPENLIQTRGRSLNLKCTLQSLLSVSQIPGLCSDYQDVNTHL